MYVQGRHIDATSNSRGSKALRGQESRAALTTQDVEAVKEFQRKFARQADDLSGSDAPGVLRASYSDSAFNDGISRNCRAFLLKLSRGIGGVPDSVLSAILAMAVKAEEEADQLRVEHDASSVQPSTPPPASRLSTVCFRFRSVALSTASMWTSVSNKTQSMEYVKACCARSKGLSLHVVLAMGEGIRRVDPVTFIRTLAPHSTRWESLTIEVGLDGKDFRRVLGSPEAISINQVLRGLTMPRMTALSLVLSQPIATHGGDEVEGYDGDAGDAEFEEPEEEGEDEDEDEEEDEGNEEGDLGHSKAVRAPGLQLPEIHSERIGMHSRETIEFSHLWTRHGLQSLKLRNIIPSASPTLSSLCEFTIQLGTPGARNRTQTWDIRPLLDLLDGMKNLRIFGIELLSTSILNPADEIGFEDDESSLPVALLGVTTVRLKIENCFQSEIEIIFCYIHLPNVQNWEIDLLPVRNDQDGSDDGLGDCLSSILDPTVFLEEIFPRQQHFPRVTSVSLSVSGFESPRNFVFPFHKFPNLMHLKLGGFVEALGTGPLNKAAIPALRTVCLDRCQGVTADWVRRLVNALSARGSFDAFEKLTVAGCRHLTKNILAFIPSDRIALYN